MRFSFQVCRHSGALFIYFRHFLTNPIFREKIELSILSHFPRSVTLFSCSLLSVDFLISAPAEKIFPAGAEPYSDSNLL